MAEQPTSNTSQTSGKGSAEPNKVTPVIKTLKKPDSASAAPSQAAAEKKEEKASPAQPKAASSSPKKKASTSKKKPAAKTKAANNNKTKTSKTPARSVKTAPKKKAAPQKKKVAAKKPSQKPAAVKIAKNQTQSQTQLMETLMNTVNTKNFEKISQEAANAGKENMEALQKFASAYAQGYQDCIATYTDMVQKSVEKQSKLYKDMLGKKTINEVTESLQSASQENLNDLLANATKLSEQAVKICMTSFEPINAQLNKNIKKASEAA